MVVLKFVCSAQTLNCTYCNLKLLICMHTCLTFIFHYILNNLMLFMMVLIIFMVIPIVRLFYLEATFFMILFLSMVLMRHVPILLMNHVLIMLINHVPTLKVMLLWGSWIVNLLVGTMSKISISLI